MQIRRILTSDIGVNSMNRKKIWVWSNVVSAALLLYAAYKFFMTKQELEKEKASTKKVSALLMLANRIIRANIQGKAISSKLEELGITSVAIYGMGEIGERAMEDILSNSSVRLLYGMDIKASELYMAVPVYTLQQAVGMEKPDLILLTALDGSGKLKKEIQEKMSCEVMTIGELLGE